MDDERMMEELRAAVADPWNWYNQLETTITSISNHSLFHSYRIGVLIGLLVLSTLILFPGTATTAQQQQQLQQRKKDHDDVSDATNDTASKARMDAFDAPFTNTGGSNNENENSNNNNLKSHHRQMNLGVYVFLITITAGILWHEYGSRQEATMWRAYLRHMFT